MSRVTVVDYGLGNLFNLVTALNAVGASVDVVGDAAAVEGAERLVLPGVGAFGPGIGKLREQGIEAAIGQFCRTGRPLLGICLGMQLLVSESEEHGVHRGLDLIPGRVRRFQPEAAGSAGKVPQISWNTIERNPAAVDWNATLLKGLNSGIEMYFVHSYYVESDRPEDTLALTDYGGKRYSSVIGRDNVFGVQFHPERSAAAGLRLLKNFLEL